MRDKYGRHTFGQILLLARRLIEAGSRVVQVNWPAVANGNPKTDAWDTHAGISARPRPALPEARQRPADADRGPGRPRHAEGHAGPGHRRIRPQSHDGRQHQRQQQRPGRPRPLALLLHRPDGRRRHAGRRIYGKSDKHGSAPADNPVHPIELLATVYHAMGIDPATKVLNDLNQPRPLVDAKPVTGLFA